MFDEINKLQLEFNQLKEQTRYDNAQMFKIQAEQLLIKALDIYHILKKSAKHDLHTKKLLLLIKQTQSILYDMENMNTQS